MFIKSIKTFVNVTEKPYPSFTSFWRIVYITTIKEMVVILWCIGAVLRTLLFLHLFGVNRALVAAYGMTLKVSKLCKYNMCNYYFIDTTLIFFIFLYKNILNCRYFHTYRSTSTNKKTRWKSQKNMGSHSVTCHPTQVNAPRLNPSQ